MYNRSYIVTNCILPPDVQKKSMGARGKKITSFLLTKYSIKIYNRYINVFTRYLLIRYIPLTMQLYNLFVGITLVNTGSSLDISNDLVCSFLAFILAYHLGLIIMFNLNLNFFFFYK